MINLRAHFVVSLNDITCDAWTLESIYVAVVQAVLLYISETWVMTPSIVRDLGIFYHRVARRLLGRKLRRVIDGIWRYPRLAEAMEEAGLQDVDTYVSRRYNTATQFISTRPIVYLCLSV